MPFIVHQTPPRIPSYPEQALGELTWVQCIKMYVTLGQLFSVHPPPTIATFWTPLGCLSDRTHTRTIRPRPWCCSQGMRRSRARRLARVPRYRPVLLWSGPFRGRRCRRRCCPSLPSLLLPYQDVQPRRPRLQHPPPGETWRLRLLMLSLLLLKLPPLQTLQLLLLLVLLLHLAPTLPWGGSLLPLR